MADSAKQAGTWQPDVVEFPSAVDLAVLNLRPLLPNARVCADLTGWKRPEPSVHLQRSGGKAKGVFDHVNVQVDVRDESLDKVTDLTKLTRKHLNSLALRLDGVKSVEEVRNVMWLPDEEDDQPRMTWEVSIVVVGQ